MSEVVPSIFSARERAQRNWEADGFYAIVSGIAYTMLGFGIFWRHESFHFLYGESVGYLITTAAGVLLLTATRITEWFKNRFTYPRTGYVASPQETESQIDKKKFPPPKPTQEKVVGNILSVTLILLIVGIFFNQRWMIGLFTLLYVFLTWYFSNRVHIPWHKKYPPPIMGFLLSIVPVDLELTGALLLLLGGLFDILAGMRNLLFYLMEHPVQRA